MKSENPKILIAYFSHSGNKRVAVKEIHKHVGGDLFEIVSVNPYPQDYNAVVNVAKQEKNANKRPGLTAAMNPFPSEAKHCNKSEFKLLYLWYDVLGKQGVDHRDEIDEFTRIATSDGIHFSSLSYQELIIILAKKYRKDHPEYVQYLTDRNL